MKLLKHLTVASLVCATSASYAVYGPCDEKKPHIAAFVSGEFLYWRPDQAGMTYSVSVENPLLIITGSKNKEVHQTSDWGPGFRVGAGVNFIKAPCDVSFYWTRFHHHAHSTNSDPYIVGMQVVGVNNAFVFGGSDNDAGKAHSAWKLNMDLLELDLGYRLCFNKRYMLRPYLGVTGGWINQLQAIKYNHFFDFNTFIDAKIDQTNDFHGIGPKIGINGQFSVGWGFGIFGNFAASFFYGEANNPVTVKVSGDPTLFPLPKYTVKYHQNRIIPALQGQLGLKWGVMCAKHFSIDLSALYEAQYFWGTWRNQNSTTQNIFLYDAGYGNLMLQGGTWELKLTF